jgi:hypothetical protein
MIFPLDVEIVFEDGSKKIEKWDGQALRQSFKYTGNKKIISAHIDPEQKMWLDRDLNNNSLTIEPQKTPLYKFAAKAIFWIQNAMLTVGFLM